MKRPLVPVALCYGAGLLLGEQFPFPGPNLLAVTCGALVATLAWEKYRPWLLGALVALCGWTNLVLHTQAISPQDLRTVAGTNAHWATVTGTLIETPSLRVFEPENATTFRTMAQVDIDTVEF